MPDAICPSALAARIVSLDVFRGLTMAFMVVVNNPGSWATVYPPLLHAPWEGCTPADFVFPFFLFIVGVAITLSKRSTHWTSAAWRGAKLILLGLLFPMIKNLWTSSYVVYTAGGAALLFAACYWLVDIKGVRRPMCPLVVLGTNAIALLVISGLLTKTLIYVNVTGPLGQPIALGTRVYQQYFVPLASPMNASLLYALANLALLYGVLWGMYKRGVFLKV